MTELMRIFYAQQEQTERIVDAIRDLSGSLEAATEALLSSMVSLAPDHASWKRANEELDIYLRRTGKKV